MGGATFVCKVPDFMLQHLETGGVCEHVGSTAVLNEGRISKCAGHVVGCSQVYEARTFATHGLDRL